MVQTVTSEAPTPILPRNLKRFKYSDIEPLEFARQLTLMESQLYQKIRPLECMNKIWSDKNSNKAPNIKAMIETSNNVRKIIFIDLSFIVDTLGYSNNPRRNRSTQTSCGDQVFCPCS